ncbi:hypothetical protein ACHHYP_14274 [Achlya hypogyna]|uniref:Uncharacterized protein n=1 Tax=Achlya hypogyna TaxID=1202772 RepID=A0A1V9YDI6_ACHHY|nr:hypothetical protein ACHHYP_14274 [Achlya hypogyna]
MAAWNPLGVADYGSDSDDSDMDDRALSAPARASLPDVANVAESPVVVAPPQRPEAVARLEAAALPELPPLPTTKCRSATQAKINKYLEHTKRGLSFTASLRSKKEFDNPYILEKVVDYFDIEEMQSNLDKAKFNPYGYHIGDNYNRLALALRNEEEAIAQAVALNPALRWTQPQQF